MEELLIAAPTTALDEPPTQKLQRPTSHLFQGVLAFLAVVGIGATLTVLISPPVRVRVVTVEKQRPPEIRVVERIVTTPIEKQPILLPPAQRPKRGTLPPQVVKPRVMPNSKDCHDDPLCGIDTSKQ